MKLFNIYASTELLGFNLQVIERQAFEDTQGALDFAKEFSYDLYHQNPVKDVVEIMQEKKVSEDTASEIYKMQMEANTIYFIDEIIEFNGRVIEYIRHGG